MILTFPKENILPDYYSQKRYSHKGAKMDLTKVFQQFANTASEGEAAVLDKKKIKRALKVVFLCV